MSNPNSQTPPESRAETTQYFPAVDTHLIHSKHVAQTYKIQIMQPAQIRGAGARFPVIYVSDGNFTFDALKGISYSIQGASPDAPQFILVGISYPSECPEAGAVLRIRDMTFPGDPQLSTEPPPIEGVLVAEAGPGIFAGAALYQDFLLEELFPFIDARYGTLPDDRTYFGHSLSGGFGLSTLFTRPELFRRYIISSPALSYHGESATGEHYDNTEYLIARARE